MEGLRISTRGVQLTEGEDTVKWVLTPMDNSPLRLCTGSVPFLGLRTKRGRRCSRSGAYDDEALDDCGVDRRLECAGTGHRGDPSPGADDSWGPKLLWKMESKLECRFGVMILLSAV
jgi:hypothetical protein